MLRLQITPKAKDDLLNIWQYSFETWGSAQADSYLFDLEVRLNGLLETPLLGKPLDIVRKGLRHINYKRHIVLYRVQGNVIIVVRVLHDTMDIQRHL